MSLSTQKKGEGKKNKSHTQTENNNNNECGIITPDIQRQQNGIMKCMPRQQQRQIIFNSFHAIKCKQNEAFNGSNNIDTQIRNREE